MDVGKGAEQLVDVKFDFDHRHRGFHFVEVARRSINRLRHILKNQVQVDFILLQGSDRSQPRQSQEKGSLKGKAPRTLSPLE